MQIHYFLKERLDIFLKDMLWCRIDLFLSVWADGSSQMAALTIYNAGILYIPLP